MKEKNSKPASRSASQIGRSVHKGNFATKKKEIVNPFDKFANSKKKHDVLNRRVKGEDRNMGRAREKVSYFVVIFFFHSLFLSFYITGH